MQNKLIIILVVVTFALAAVGVLIDRYSKQKIEAAGRTGEVTGQSQGQADGFQEGKDEGYQSGHTTGYSQGEEEGYKSGLETGLAEGESAGHETGFELGYQEGEKSGYSAGESVGFITGRNDGFESGYTSGFLEVIGAEAMVHNTTYTDIVDRMKEIESTSAVEINNMFEKEGIRSGFAWVKLSKGNGSGYSLVAFETVDKGIVIFDPKSHDEIEIEIGDHLLQKLGYYSPGVEDTILSITISW